MTLTNDIVEISTSKTEGFHFPLELGPESIRRKHFDLRALKRFISIAKKSKGDMVLAVQAGGNVGVWPRILADHYDTVITFEPEWHCFVCLCVNCQQQNIIKFGAALGDKPGPARVYGKSISSHRVRPADAVGREHHPLTIQTPLDSMNLPRCDAILLDVEGYEYRALAGAQKTINKFRPQILIEERKKVKVADDKEPKPGRFLERNGYRQVCHLAGDGIYLPR